MEFLKHLPFSLFTAVLSVSSSSGDVKDSDSGLGQSHRSDSGLDQSDIIVFGTDVELPDLNKSKFIVEP